MDRSQCSALWEYVKCVPDPRHRRGVRYPWKVLLAVLCAALLSGHTSGRAIAQWAALHVRALSQAFGVPLARAPSEATIDRALRLLDVSALEQQVAAFGQAVEAQRAGTISGRARAVDGKDVRGASLHGPRVQLISLVAHGSGTTLAQRDVRPEHSELEAVPALLGAQDLVGHIITGDALHTQRALAAQIRAQGGHYVLVVKRNQPTLYEDISLWFHEESAVPREAATRCTTWDKGHGRLECRTLQTSTVLNAHLDWPGLQQVFVRTRRWRRTGEEEQRESTVYGITSLSPEVATAADLERLVRGHWTIENRSHYVRDETLREDRGQMHAGTAPEALAALRNGVLTALRQTGRWAYIPDAVRFCAASPDHAFALLGIGRL